MSMIVRGAACLVLAAGCNTTPYVIGDLHEVAALPAVPDRDLDVLLVIDDSPSMADKQAALAASFPRMIDKLAQLDGGLPNLHIGVITSDMGTQSVTGAPAVDIPGYGGCVGLGDDGALQHTRDPDLPDAFVIDVADPASPDGRRRNYTGELRDEVARLVNVGDAGCGLEQHLAAVRRSLVNPANAGFLRPDANLAVVILADEDDCSVRDPALFGSDPAVGPLQSFRCFEHGVICDPDAPRTPGAKQGCRPREGAPLVEPIAPLIDALLAAKPDPRQVMVAAVVGDPAPVAVTLDTSAGAPVATLAPSCSFSSTGGAQHADPAVRLAAFVAGFPGRSQLTSICSADLTAPLDAIGATAKRLVGDPCIDTSALADTSPDPGVQPACDVFDVRDSAIDAPVPLPPCDGAAPDCYTLVRDAVRCPAGDDHLRLGLRRSRAAEADTWTHVRCQLAR